MNDVLNSWVYKNLYFLKYRELTSTNEAAADLLKKGVLGGPSVILALYQSQGRGQMQTKWHSDRNNNLTFSLILTKLQLNIQQQFVLNKAISLALLLSTQTFVKSLKIKWPNDLYYNDQKLAGILVENQIQQNKISRSIIGIGLNVNQTQFPDHIPNPTSINIITNNTYKLEVIESEFVYSIYHHITTLLKKENQIEELYNQHLYGINEIRRFEDKHSKFEGIIKGVNENGQLIILRNNIIQVYNFKEVKYLI